MFAFITLSWFTFSKQLEAGGIFIKTSDPSIDCTATSYYYIRSQGNTYAPQEDTEDNIFNLMQYDSLFGGNNTHTYAVERMELDVIHKEKAPFYVTLDGRELPHFLHRKEYEMSNEGWYYSQSLRSVQIRYENPKADHDVMISFEQLDLIGM